MKVDNGRVSSTDWGDVDKSALGRALAEAYAAGEASKAVIREAYAFVPEDAFGEDAEGKPAFKFSMGWGPHHELDGETLIVNRGGVIGAAQALAGARAEPSLSRAELATANRHIRKHYRELEMEAPESLAEEKRGREAEGNHRRFIERIGSVSLLEAAEGQPRRVKAIGITAGVVNGNGRRYPADVLRAAVEELQTHLHESAGQGRLVTRAAQLLGEAEHPSDKAGRPSLLETVVRWENVDFDGAHVLLEGSILPTSKGKDILALIEGGVYPPVSQRGYGESRMVKDGGQRIEEVTELTITGYDLVMEASDPEAGITMIEGQQARGDDKVDIEELQKVISEHPEWFRGLVADEVKEMSEAQRQALESEMRKSLGVAEDDDLMKALNEAAQAQREVAEQKRKAAIEEAVGAATKDLPYGDDLNVLFVEAIRAQAARMDGEQIADEVRRLVEAKRKEYDRVVATARMAKMGKSDGGVTVIGPVIESETGIPEYARGAHEFTEAMIRRQIIERRNLAQPKSINEEVAVRILARFDECYKLPLMREAKLLQETELSTDLNIPYSASRAILAAVWPRLISTSIFDVDTVDQSPVRVYYESYANVSGKHVTITDEAVTADHDAWVQMANKMIEPGTVVVTTSPAGTTFTEGTDYYIDYLDGKIWCPSGVTITDGQSLLVDYHYDLVREGENVAIQRGKFTLGYATLEAIANRLALEITSEAVVFSRSQLGWDATARTLAGLVNELSRLIDKNLMYNALTRSLMTASNSGGTWTSATDPIIEFVSYLGVSKEKVASRYYEPTFILMSNTRGDAVANWDGFTQAGSRPDATLNANGYIGRLKGLPVFTSTEFSSSYALVGNREIVAYRIYQPMQLKGPYPSYSSNNLVAADQWYAEQYDGWVSPIAGKVSHVVIS